MESRTGRGEVFLVGAGPGDVRLCTLFAMERIAWADLIICDYLVNPELLRFANSRAQIVRLEHHSRVAPDEIDARMIREAKAGRCVVHLKGGDPCVFGRLAQQTQALSEAGVPFEVIPGITAAQAAAAYACVPLTDATKASAVAFVTAHQRSDGSRPLDYARLAQFPGTLVFYMGISRADDWSRELIAAGKPADTPVAIVRRCSWPDQTTARCTLETLEATVVRLGLRPPAVIIVGETAGDMPATNWFESQPLFGVRVMVTRPVVDAPYDEMHNQLRALGADARIQPVIEIGPPEDWQPLDDVLGRLDTFDWVVFSSANGVDAFFERLWASGADPRRLGRAKLAAIGLGTAARFTSYGVRHDLMPGEYRAEALADAIIEATPRDAGRTAKALLIRASRGREVLAERLTAAGIEVEQVVAYTSRDVAEPDEAVAAALRAGQIDWITVTSSAIARNLVRLFGGDLRRARLVSISPVTSEVLRELGYPPEAEASRYDICGVLDVILSAVESGHRGRV